MSGRWARWRFEHFGSRRLQEAQAAQHIELVEELAERHRAALHELADAVLRLQAVADRLEHREETLETDP